MASVLDACAMIAFLRGEPGAEVVKRYMDLPDCFAHAINLCEVEYKFAMAADEPTAAAALLDLARVGVRAREDLDAAFRARVTHFKVCHTHLSLADCCALALGERMDATLVTSDREFKKASPDVAIVLIR